MMSRRVLNKSQQGKKNRRLGAEFEKTVRYYLESAGWLVSKWQNNVDLEKQEIMPAKSNRFLMRTTGFPDFICIRKMKFEGKDLFFKPDFFTTKNPYEVVLVESKINGQLTREEKDKINFLKNKGFDVIVASCGENKEVIFK